MFRIRVAVTLTVLVAVLLAGCGGGSASEGSSTGGAGGTGAAAQTSATRGSPSASTGRYELTAADLPAGWRDSSTRRSDYRLTVCGIDLETRPPRTARMLRFARSAIGPFLEQYVRTYDTDRVTSVIAGLRAALPACHEYTVQDPDSGRRVSFTVKPLVVKGLAADDVAWRQTSVGEHPITADYLITRRDTSAVVLVSYQVNGPPQPEVLQQAYRALVSR